MTSVSTDSSSSREEIDDSSFLHDTSYLYDQFKGHDLEHLFGLTPSADSATDDVMSVLPKHVPSIFYEHIHVTSNHPFYRSSRVSINPLVATTSDDEGKVALTSTSNSSAASMASTTSTAAFSSSSNKLSLPSLPRFVRCLLLKDDVVASHPSRSLKTLSTLPQTLATSKSEQKITPLKKVLGSVEWKMDRPTKIQFSYDQIWKWSVVRVQEAILGPF